MGKFVFVFLITFTLFSFKTECLAQSEESAQSEGFYTVKVYRATALGVNNTIFIAQADGEVEEVNLPNRFGRNVDEQESIIIEVLNRFYNNGFELVSSNAGGFGSMAGGQGFYYIETYVFRK